MCTTRDRRSGGGVDPALRDGDDLYLDLFRGPADRDESADERAARLAAARDILAELLREGVHDAVAREHARFALLTAAGPVAVVLERRQVGEAA
ncbi:hypothetical protein [Streptomyces sp. NPDC021020]|uniref:hypothetical protein n=1 Tax=Streptomyces sp. NPDC021020 TaxID=3365109 RepID=UPI0037B76489